MARYLVPLLPQLNWRHEHPLLESQPCPPDLLLLTPEEVIMMGKHLTALIHFSLLCFTSPLCPPRPEHCFAHLGSDQSPHLRNQAFASHFLFIPVIALLATQVALLFFPFCAGQGQLWIYVPEPPFLHPVTWDYKDVIVVVKDPKLMGLWLRAGEGR